MVTLTLSGPVGQVNMILRRVCDDLERWEPTLTAITDAQDPIEMRTAVLTLAMPQEATPR